MKVFIFLLACVLCSPAFAGDIKESEVPAKVKAYIVSHFPKAANIKWDFEKDDQVYEAEFKINGLVYKLEITPVGILHSSKEDLLVSSLPKVVTEYIGSNYPDYQILGANKKVKSNTVTYDVGIKGKNSYGRTQHRNLYFDGQGKLIKSKS